MQHFIIPMILVFCQPTCSPPSLLAGRQIPRFPSHLGFYTPCLRISLHFGYWSASEPGSTAPRLGDQGAGVRVWQVLRAPGCCWFVGCCLRCSCSMISPSSQGDRQHGKWAADSWEATQKPHCASVQQDSSFFPPLKKEINFKA